MSSHRLPAGGLIDRSRPILFRWCGRTLRGYVGDTLASALLANGVRIVGRSFKYHRPRGILAAGLDEPNAIVQLESGAVTIPNRKATEVELWRAEREGYDAFLIGNASDAGIQIAREVVNIPVLALTECSLLATCMMGGGNLGLITVSDKWTPRIMDNVRRLNMESRVVGAEGLETTPIALKKAMVDEKLRDGVRSRSEI